MIAGLSCGKGEAATGAALLRYYAVIVVEELLFSDCQKSSLQSLGLDSKDE